MPLPLRCRELSHFPHSWHPLRHPEHVHGAGTVGPISLRRNLGPRSVVGKLGAMTHFHSMFSTSRQRQMWTVKRPSAIQPAQKVAPRPMLPNPWRKRNTIAMLL